MERCDLPIAFFDSGVGGISVLREAVRLMPHENFLYFGDSINAPYGTKTVEKILRLSLTHAEYFYKKGVKAIVVACNTATGAAIEELRSIYKDIPVIGIEPAIKPAALMADHPTVLVMATPVTVHAQKFNDLLGHYADKAEVIALPCPGLMEFVEKGQLEGKEVRGYLEKLLMPYLQAQKVDAIVLGCTHYPFLKGEIRKVSGDGIRIFDGGEGTARELCRRLGQMDLLTAREEMGEITIEESLPEKVDLCRTLLTLAYT